MLGVVSYSSSWRDSGFRRIFEDRSLLEKLMLLEKDRRGLNRNELVFIGVANVSSTLWCPMKAYLTSKNSELNYFSAYLEDRLVYSYELGYIDKVPESPEKILDVGNEISIKDIEKLLKERKEFLGNNVEDSVFLWSLEGDFNVIFFEKKIATILYRGLKLALINPTLPQKVKFELIEKAKEMGALVIDFEALPPKIRGTMLEFMLKEDYPSIRWNFQWGKYVVIAAPDGLTDNLVYEFKTTKNFETFKEIVRIAKVQADIYGYFYRRSVKKVQVYVMSGNLFKTMVDIVNRDNAVSVLNIFKNVDEGVKPEKPEKWKCRVCEFKGKCPLS